MRIAAMESTATMIEVPMDSPENIEPCVEEGIAKILAREAIKTPVSNPSLPVPYTSITSPTFKSELLVLALTGSETAT